MNLNMIIIFQRKISIAWFEKTSIQCQIKRLLKREEFDQVGQIVTVASGGQWPHKSQREQG